MTMSNLLDQADTRDSGSNLDGQTRITDLSLRDQLAIKLGVCMADNDEVNEMIFAKNKREAGLALLGAVVGKYGLDAVNGAHERADLIKTALAAGGSFESISAFG